MNSTSISPSMAPKQYWLKQLGFRSYLYEGLVYQDFLKAAEDLTQSSVGFFHLYNEADQSIRLAVWSDGVFPICTTTHTNHYPMQEAGIWADAIRLRQPVIYNDYARHPHRNALPEGHFPLIRQLSIPIFDNDQIVAILGVGNASDPYPQAIASELMDFAHQAYTIVQTKIAEIEQRRHHRIMGAETDTLSLLVNMVSCLTGAAALRDEYTSQHSQNVSNLAVAIAQTLGLGESTILGLRLGGLVHDIGKMAIPSEILTKPGRLNPAEYNLIKTHVQRGAEIFSSMKFPWPVLEIIEQHHERLDGSGYPAGLRAESIILEARIIAVADVFDSMASSRPYRFAPGVDKALAELTNNRSLLYDPYVVDALIHIVKNADEQFWQCYPHNGTH